MTIHIRKQKGTKSEPGRPTPERLFKSGGNFEVADGRGGLGTMRMLDDPLSRMMQKENPNARPGRPLEKAARGSDRRPPQINETQYRAGDKFRHHWFHAGLAGNLKSMDLDRVFGGEGASCGMPRNENEAHHRAQYRAACRDLGPMLEKILADAICKEIDLAVIGMRFGYGNEPQSRAAMLALFREGLDRLARLWGL